MESYILKVSKERIVIFEKNWNIFFVARENLPQWDKNIQSLCYQVNGIIEKIAAVEPDWMNKTMDDQMT